MSQSREALNATLRALSLDAGITEQASWKMIEEAPPDLRDMGVVYERVNQHLASALKRAPFSIRHVTGEARVLVDPAHRRILRDAHEKGERSAVACFFETAGPPTAWDFVALQHRDWGLYKWLDLVDLLELAARQVICISKLPQAEDVHFSVFGDSLVLLQEPHHHSTHKKWVWYIESPMFADLLRERLEQLFARTVAIEPRSFDQLLDWLHEFETFEVLTEIAETEDLSDEEGDIARKIDVSGVGPRPDSIHSRLVSLGFADPERVRLTRLGREWFDQVSADARGS
jgi:hypothetical protein